ncbi:MAG: hypothetical protein ACLTSX_13680 [Collinsella sp.]
MCVVTSRAASVPRRVSATAMSILALAHAHQREFCDDEERVHQQEEHHEQQTYSGLHTDQSSFQGKNSVPHYRGAGDNMSESIDDFPKQSPN